MCASDPVANGGLIGTVTAVLAKCDPPDTPAEVREFGRRFHELCPWARSQSPPPSRPTLKTVQRHIEKLRQAKPLPTARQPTDDQLRAMGMIL